MVGKNNIKKQLESRGQKVETYSIKKFKVGAASVLIGVGLFFGAGAVEASDSVAQSREATNNPDEGANTANISSENLVKPVANKIENTHEKVAEAVAEKLVAQSGEKNQDNAATKEVDKSLLTKKIEELKAQLERVKNNIKQQSVIDEAVKKLESAEALLENNPTQEVVDKKVKEISSYVSILKSIKIEVKDSGNNEKKIETAKEVDNSSKETLEKTTNSEELKKVTEELSKAVFNARDLTSADDKKVVEEAKTVIKDANASLDNSSLTKAELDDLFKRATKSRNSVMNVITRFMSGKRDFRNGKEIPKEDLRADASVSNEALYGHLTFLDSNGVSKNISEDTIPVV
uniref:YSIRK-type signal peptide-containing protein n=1 Tax=Gemella haemolysans TaxID=1379 RepID=UPI0028D0A01D